MHPAEWQQLKPHERQGALGPANTYMVDKREVLGYCKSNLAKHVEQLMQPGEAGREQGKRTIEQLMQPGEAGREQGKRIIEQLMQPGEAGREQGKRTIEQLMQPGEAGRERGKRTISFLVFRSSLR